MSLATESTATVSYSIGAVARLTGIPVDTVRMWERRYGVVQPQRNEGNKRRYSASDVARLTLIRRLVDRGNPISTVATLSKQQLRERLQLHEHALVRSATTDAPRRTLIFGETLPFDKDAGLTNLGRLELLGALTEFADFERAALASRPQVVICEYLALTQDSLLQIFNLTRRVGNQTTVVVYNYAASAVLQRLRLRPEIIVLRAPVTLAAIEPLLADGTTSVQAPATPIGQLDPGVPDDATPRRYSNWQLAEVARLSTSIKCECPKHLVDLLYRLCAFEAYSLDCENRNDQDQAIHAYLNQATARARTTIEKALAQLIELEGMPVPKRSDSSG
jgi:MerR family transcriptional regulator, light-induced transcriptional regulator